MSTQTPEDVAPAVPDAIPAPTAGDIQPVANETRDRIITGIVTGAPIVALFFVGWQLWDKALGWSDIIVFFLLYIPCGLGITVGFHRLFTHRSFKCKTWVRATLAILGSAAIEGPIISWCADHRKHHAFSDLPGDPHSPHVDHGEGWRGALGGLLHAHVGWIFMHDERALKTRYAPDLIADPVVSKIDSTFIVWALGGLAAAFALGWIIGGSFHTALTGLLWGGAVRMLVLHHATYSINSLCHYFGRRPYETGDQSTNLAWLAPVTLGEAWHNSHHAFPTSARHGVDGHQLDISAFVISGLEKTGLAWDVVRVKPEVQKARLRTI